MMDNPNVPCSDQQMAVTQEFKRAVFSFLANNSKYVQPSHELEMALDVALELLELLMVSPQERSNAAPTGNSDHP